MKKCSKCRKPKEIEQFRIVNKETGRRRAHCNDCQREYQTSWHERNKETHNAAIKKDKKRRKEEETPVIRQLKEKPCTDCDQEFPYYVMDFDHRPGEEKSFEISAGLQKIRAREDSGRNSKV